MINRYLSIVRLALPVMVAQVSHIVVSFADNIMVGRYSTEALASASFVNNVMNVAVLCAIGFSYGLTPLIGMLFGSGKNSEIGLTLRAGVYANVAVGVLLLLIMGAVYACVGRMGQPQELLPLIRPYFLIMLSSLLPMVVFNAFSQWSFGIRNTLMPMWILVACNLLNIGGNYLLIYGRCGMPELGLTGAGIATLTVRLLGTAAIVLVFFRQRRYREYREGFMDAGRRVGGELMRKVVNTSWPVALQMTFETSAFSVCAVFAGMFGAVALAAYQILVVIGMLGFCIYYSIGTAISVLVSNREGAADRAGSRRVAFDGYIVMLFFATLSTLCFIFMYDKLIWLFTDDVRVAALAGSFMLPLALYQLGDATQITFANALRGTSNVMPMLWIAFVSYVVVGLPCSWALAFPLGLESYGLVLSFSVSLFLAGCLFLRSFLRTTSAAAPASKNPGNLV